MGVEAIPDQACWALNARSIHSKKEEKLALTSEENTPRNLTKPWFSKRQLSVGFGTVLRYLAKASDLDKFIARLEAVRLEVASL